MPCCPTVHWYNLRAAAGIGCPSLLDLKNTSNWSCRCLFWTRFFPFNSITNSDFLLPYACCNLLPSVFLSNSHTYLLFFPPKVLIISRWKIIILHSCLFLYWGWPKRWAFLAGQGQLPRNQGLNNHNLSTTGEKE